MASYRDAGVNIAEADRLIALIRGRNPSAGIGSFGAFFELPAHMQRPVLVSSTDGVGTKLELALAARRYREIGRDCVAMCANDILCHGAAPLYFLDYLACGTLDADVAAEIVYGMLEACEEIGCSLSGGETAEMPGMYAEGTYDVAGFIVGVVEADELTDGSAVRPGDTLVALASAGVHSNGFSLIRALDLNLEERVGCRRLGDALLDPTILYGPAVLSLPDRSRVHGMAHITGGGLYENVPRMAQATVGYEIRRDALPHHPVFDAIAAAGVDEDEMFRTFNMGTGMVLAVDSGAVEGVCGHLDASGITTSVIGEVTDGGGVCIA